MNNRIFYRIIDLFGIFLTVAVLGLLCLFWFGTIRSTGNTPIELAEDMLPAGKMLELHQGNFKGAYFEYYSVRSIVGEDDGFIFNSKDFSPDIIGYNGRIFIIIFTDKKGLLKDFRVLQANETKEYFDRVLKSKSVFLNKNIFHPSTSEDLDMVTGATISSEAMSAIIHKSGTFQMVRYRKNIEVYFGVLTMSLASINFIRLSILSFERY